MTKTLAVLTVLFLSAGIAASGPQNLTDAIDEHRRLAAESSAPGVLNDLANLLVLAGHTIEAESIYRRVLEVDATNGEAQFNLGLLLQNQGHIDEAEQLFLAVLELHPRHEWALYQLGAVHEARGERNKAIEAYAKALALDPELYFADVNPQVVTNGLLTEALLEAARLRDATSMAPMKYARPREITEMLLSLPTPVKPGVTDPVTADPVAPDEDGS